MVEKIYYQNAVTATTYSFDVGLSGIVKRIRFCLDGASNIADDASGSFIICIDPITTTIAATNATKFIFYAELEKDANPSGRHFATKLWSYDTNFYVDKKDYLMMRHAFGNTMPIHLVLDIVPVSDKTRLYLGGEYHNQ